MLKLKDPIVFYPYIYPNLGVVRIEADLRAQVVTVEYGPIQEIDGTASLGVLDETKEQPQFRAAPTVRSVRLEQNMREPDLDIARFFQGLMRAMEPLDQIIVNSQDAPGGIATSPYLNGEEEHSLECAFESLGDRPIGLRRKRLEGSGEDGKDKKDK